MGNKKILKKDFDFVRELIKSKDVDHQSKKVIDKIFNNLKNDKTLENRLISAGIKTLERLYNIAVITEIDSNTGRIQVIEWFKERRKGERGDKKKSFEDIRIL